MSNGFHTFLATAFALLGGVFLFNVVTDIVLGRAVSLKDVAMLLACSAFSALNLYLRWLHQKAAERGVILQPAPAVSGRQIAKGALVIIGAHIVVVATLILIKSGQGQ